MIIDFIGDLACPRIQATPTQVVLQKIVSSICYDYFCVRHGAHLALPLPT
jgi:hypothetical protein